VGCGQWAKWSGVEQGFLGTGVGGRKLKGCWGQSCGSALGFFSPVSRQKSQCGSRSRSINLVYYGEQNTNVRDLADNVRDLSDIYS
jgi:hypothetical protein